MINGLKVLAITLARGGSKSIPSKNIALLNGKPLLEYTIDEVKKSDYIDKYVVSTDDEKIANVCKDNEVPYVDRPEELATDTTTSSDALKDAVARVGGSYDIIVEVMCTNPLKTAIDIDACIELLYYTKSNSVVSVVQVFDHHPSRVKYIGSKGELCDFYPEKIESRRQDLNPNAYIRNGSIYAMKSTFLIRNGIRYDKNTIPYIMDQENSINIDEPDDLLLAEIKLKRRDGE